MQNLSLEGGPLPAVAELDSTGPNFQNSFPSLQSAPMKPQDSGVFESSLRNFYGTNNTVTPPPGFGSRLTLAPEFVPRSMLNLNQPATGKMVKSSKLSVEDSEAFPTLGSAAVKGPKKHHGKRGHGHSHKEREPSLMADIVKMMPAAQQSPPKDLKSKNTATTSKENSAAAQSIPAPEHIPWLETGDRANKAYLKARQDAIKHGGARNKFLQRCVLNHLSFSIPTAYISRVLRKRGTEMMSGRPKL